MHLIYLLSFPFSANVLLTFPTLFMFGFAWNLKLIARNESKETQSGYEHTINWALRAQPPDTRHWDTLWIEGLRASEGEWH